MSSVVLIVDQPQRDLAGLTLTAAELARAGVTCHLVGASQRWREIFALRPDFVLLFNLRKTQAPLALALPRAGIGVGLLDTEGAVWRSLEDYTMMLGPLEARNTPEVICAWSPVFEDELVAGGWFRREQFSLTGCPRFDFYHPDWRSVMTAGGDESLAQSNGHLGHVLLATNYVDANSRFLDARAVRRELQDMCGLEADQAEQRLEDQRRGVRGFIELARAIATDFPNRRVVLRPHPFESPEPYRQGLADLRNVVVNTTGPPQIPLFGAVASIQRSSTIGIESRLTDIPSLSPRWIPGPCPDIQAVEDVSVPCERYEDVRGALARIWEGSFQVPEPVADASRTIIRDRFYRIDGRAHARVAEAIRGRLPRQRRVDEGMCARLLHGLDVGALSARQRFARNLRLRLGRSPEWSFRALREVREGKWEGTDQSFDVAGVESILQRVRAAEAQRGVASAAVTVAAARDIGAYAYGYSGAGVTVRPA